MPTGPVQLACLTQGTEPQFTRKRASPKVIVCGQGSQESRGRCKLANCQSANCLAPLAWEQIQGACRKAERLKWRHMSSKPQKSSRSEKPHELMSCSLSLQRVENCSVKRIGSNLRHRNWKWCARVDDRRCLHSVSGLSGQAKSSHPSPLEFEHKTLWVPNCVSFSCPKLFGQRFRGPQSLSPCGS